MRAIQKPAGLVALLVLLSTMAGPVSAGSGSLNYAGSGAGFVREAIGTASPSPLDVAGSFTVEAWINPSSITTRPILSDSAYVLETFNPPATSNLGIAFTLFTANGAFIVTRGSGLTPGVWNHVAAVFNAATNTCYLAINGVVNAPTPNCIGIVANSLLTNFNQLFGVGTNVAGDSNGNNPGNLRFFGGISEIRISNVVRYTSTFSPSNNFSPDANTLALWHINEPPGSISFVDSSGGGHTLSAVGLTSVAGGPAGGPVQTVAPSILQLLLDD